MRATAIAHPNIALIKYWGKRDAARNLPAVGSLSITLDALHARTIVVVDPQADADSVLLNGREDPPTAARATAVLDLLRRHSGTASAVRVVSENDFPTGAGLASSAAGFAALVTAAAAAMGMGTDAAALVEAARIGSGSAPRSLFGGFVLLRNSAGGGVCCEPVLAPREWPLRVVIAITTAGPKEVSSRDGMTLSRETSPYYGEWLHSHEADLDAGLECVRRLDFARLAELAEHNCLKMHAVMMTTRPPLLYWTPATLACLQAVRELRRAGTPVFFTIDAGPQVKAVCEPGASAKVAAALAAVPGVTRIIESGLGEGARLLDDDD